MRWGWPVSFVLTISSKKLPEHSEKKFLIVSSKKLPEHSKKFSGTDFLNFFKALNDTDKKCSQMLAVDNIVGQIFF